MQLIPTVQRSTLGLDTGDSPVFAGATLSGLTAGRIPYTSTGGLIADTANFRFDATAVNPTFRARLLNTSTAQGGLTNEMRTLYAIMKGNGASRIAGVKRGISVQMDDDTVANVTITGAANNGSGLVRITAASHGYTTGDGVGIYGVTGTTEANGVWLVTVITANTFDLQGSTFANAYVSGGIATNRSSMTGVHVLLQPTLSRTNAGTGTAFNDDLNGFTVQASGNGKATDAFYVAGNPSISGAPAWVNCFATDANANFFFRAIGTAYTYGIDLSSATMDSGVPAIALGVGHNIQLDTATGTKIGTSSSQKIGLWGATPVVSPSSTTDLRQALIDIGAYTTGGASPLDLNGGAFASATASIGSAAPSASAKLMLVDEATSSPTFALEKYTTGGAPTIISYHGRNSAAAKERTRAADSLFVFNHRGHYAAADTGSATLTGNVASFRAVAEESFTASAQGTAWQFYATAIGATSASIRMLISSAGLSVGQSLAARGTTQPTNALNIYNGTAPVGTLTDGVSIHSASGKLKLVDAAGLAGWVVSASAANSVSPTAPNRTLTVEVNGTTYYIHCKTTND